MELTYIDNITFRVILFFGFVLRFMIGRRFIGFRIEGGTEEYWVSKK